MAIKFLNSVNADSGVLYVDADNNRVGIGTTSPKRQLHIHADTATTDARIQITDESTTQAVDKGIAIIKSNNQDGYFWNYSDAHLYFGTNAVQRMRIANNGKLLLNAYGSGTNTGTLAYALAVDSSGNVIESTIQANPAGIDGTGTADYLTKWLDGDTLTDSNVYEASGDLVTTLNLKSSSSYPQLKLTDTDNSSTSSIRSAGGSLQHVLHDDTKSHVFYPGTTSTELMRIKGSGAVGIGQSNPVENLEIYDASANTWVVVETGSNNAGTQFINTTSAWTVGIKGADSDKFYIGNQEGLSSGYFVLDTSGNLQLTAYTEGYLKSDANGNITVDTSIIEDTLDSVTDRGATTTNAITVGGLTVDTDTLYVDTTNNRVGIHTTSPDVPLHISGEDSIIRLGSLGSAGGPHGIQFGYTSTDGMSMYYRTTPEYLIWEDSTGVSGTGLMVLERAGNLGIGNTAPSEKLHVTGNVRVTGAYYDSSNSPGLSGQILSSTATGTDWVSLSEIQGVDGTGTANYLAKWSDIDTITDSVVYDDGTSVGIGTTSPYHKLHVKQNSNAATGIRIENSLDNNGTDDSDAAAEIFFQAASNNGHLRVHGSPTDVASEHQIDLGSTASTSFLTFSPSGTEKVRIASDGNVGIGTTSPNYQRHVDGSVGITEDVYHSGDNNTYLRFSGDRIILQAGGYEMLRLIEGTTSEVVINDGSRDLDFRVESDTNTHALFLQGSSGQIGIGTASPQEELEVKSASFTTVAVNTDRNSAGENIGSFAFYGKNNATTPENLLYSRIMGSMDSVTDGSESGDIYFQQINSGTIQETFRVNADGSVRLNTYTTGVLVTDANGNVSASTDYHTQDTADARYVNVTGDTMTGALNISSSTTWGTATTEALTIKNTGSGGDINAEHSLGRIRWQTNGTNAAAIDAIRDTPGNGHNVDIAFFTNTGGSSTTIAERMRINYNGNVGIGTSDPSTRLYVDGGESTFNRGNSNGTIATFRGTNAEQAVIGTLTSWFDSNVGIGTTSPVNGGGNAKWLTVNAASGAYSGGIVYTIDDTVKAYHYVESGYLRHQGQSGVGHRFTVNSGTQAMLITTSGNVGIGTTSPNVLLDVNKSTIGEYAYFGSGSTRQLRLSSYNTVSDHAGHKINASSGNGEITLATNSIAALTVKNNQTVQLNSYGAGYLKTDASGNVTADNSVFLTEESDTLDTVTDRGATTSNAITTGSITAQSSAYVRVRVNQTDSALIDMGVSSGGSEGFLNVQNTEANHSTDDPVFKLLLNTSEKLRVTSDGDVGIGTTSPTRTLHVAGTGRFTDNLYSTSTDVDGIKTRFLSGAANNSTNDGTLYLQYGKSHNVSIGETGSSNLYVAGNVGIGTTSPSKKLDVRGEVALDVMPGHEQAGAIRIGRSDGTSRYHEIVAYNSSTTESNYVRFDVHNGTVGSNTGVLTLRGNGDIQFPQYGAGYLKTDASGNITLDTITSVVDGTGTASYIPKWSDSDTLTDSVIYESSGSIGIGTDAPEGILNVNKEDAISSVVISRGGTDLSASTDIGSLSFKADYQGSPIDYANIKAYSNALSGVRSSMDFNVKSTSGGILTAMTAYGSGTGARIGIGTNAPSHKLTVNTGSNDIYIDEDTNINQGTGSSDTPAIYADSVIRVRQRIELWDDNDGNNYLDIRDGSTQAIKLTPDGDSWFTNNLGLGTTSPDYKLHVVGSSANVAKIYSTGFTNLDILSTRTSGNLGGIRFQQNSDTYISVELNGVVDGGFEVKTGNGDAAPTLNMKLDASGNLQLHNYGAGFLKTDANGNVSVDTTSYTASQTLDDVTDLGNTTTNDIEVGNITTKNDSGIYSFSDTVDADTSEDVFKISNQHGAKAFRVTFVCSTSNYSVAKTFEVVHAYGKTPVFFKVVDTGAWTYSSADHDFDVSFTNDATDDTKIVCSITNNSTTINADIVTTVFLGGSPTAITVTAL